MISIYVAIAENGIIGRENGIPWRLSGDMKRMSATTKGHKIIMGRKTFESILERLGKPLPERTNIVITRQKDYHPEGAVIVHSLQEAIKLVSAEEEAFVFGGAEIYKLALPHAHKLYMTKVKALVEGDTHFPPVSETEWKLASEEPHAKDEKNEFDYSFLLYERR